LAAWPLVKKGKSGHTRIEKRIGQPKRTHLSQRKEALPGYTWAPRVERTTDIPLKVTKHTKQKKRKAKKFNSNKDGCDGP
jgi:hypothetical protein